MGFPFFPTISTKGHKKREGGSRKDRTKKSSSKPSPRPDHTVSFGSASSSSSSSYSPDSPTTVLGRSPADLTRISRADLESALRRLGACDGPELDSVLAEADRDGDGWIHVDELLQAPAAAFFPEIEAAADDDDDGGLKEAFKVYDVNGDGLISAEELLRVLATLGDSDCSLDDCRRMIGVVDSDGDGFVGFDDFARMMTVAADAWVVSLNPVLSR